MARHRQWHISGWPAYLLAPFVIPIILLVVLAEKLFGLKSTADLTREDVERYLNDFLEEGGGDWDWDDFTSISITDPALDQIREEAAFVQLPLTDDGRATLRELLIRVRSM
jgi:hypothetical protein